MEITVKKFPGVRAVNQEDVKSIVSWPRDRKYGMGDVHPALDDDWNVDFCMVKFTPEFYSEMERIFIERGQFKNFKDEIFIFEDNKDLMLITLDVICVLLSYYLLNECPSLFSNPSKFLFDIVVNMDDDSLVINGEPIKIEIEDGLKKIENIYEITALMEGDLIYFN